MSRPWTAEEIGLDEYKQFSCCVVCRKQSDGAKKAWGHDLCGTHFDGWVLAKTTDPALVIGTWILTEREKFAACWEATPEE